MACDDERTRSTPTKTIRDASSNELDSGQVDARAGSDASVPDVGIFDCTDVTPVSGLAERCCPSFGIDACGPGLFCAAFDGRTFPACYADHARADGESCLADLNCQSFSCTASGVCRSSPGLACTTGVGCGPGSSSNRFVCASGTCVSSDGAIGSACGVGADCSSGFCVSGSCTGGGDGDDCGVGSDCLSARCAGGVCTSGNPLSACVSPTDCNSGFCVDDRCSSGEEGWNCYRGADCKSGACVDRRCTDAGDGDPCVRATDCSSGLRCIKPCAAAESCSSECSSGSVESACLANSDCADGLPCVREALGSGVWRCGHPCWGSAQCAGGYVCSASGECVAPGAAPEGAVCTADADCSSATCASFGVAGSACSAPAGYWTRCGTCDTGYWCEDRSSGPSRGHCVGGERTPCKMFHDSVEIWSAVCHSVVSLCQRYVGAFCEGTSTHCSVDADCGADRCIVVYGCGF
ncbi:MAG: hypothetical protein HYV07_12230 [Deltaproteobacteria bacterium]|nr:hypothetical protein [Deltaproteobacteria bacterium]